MQRPVLRQSVSTTSESSSVSESSTITVAGQNGQPDRIYRVLRGQILPEHYKELNRDFTEQEKEEIFHRICLYDAPKDHTKTPPMVIWVFGPSAVGKSRLAETRAHDLFGRLENAVLVDGSIFREVHAGFCAVTRHGIKNSVVHADAWKTLKNQGKEKDGQGATTRLKKYIIDTAVASRQHLIIPETADDVGKIESFMDRLVKAGYVMHALCLWAPMEDTRRRGEPRSVREGKVWSACGFDSSAKNTLALGCRFDERIAAGEPSYGSVHFYDNTVTPHREVHVSEFWKLVWMLPKVAESHSKSCHSERRWRQAMHLAVSCARADGKDKHEVVSAGLEALRRHTSEESYVEEELALNVLVNDCRRESLFRGRLQGIAIGFLAALAAVGALRKIRTHGPS